MAHPFGPTHDGHEDDEEAQERHLVRGKPVAADPEDQRLAADCRGIRKGENDQRVSGSRNEPLALVLGGQTSKETEDISTLTQLLDGLRDMSIQQILISLADRILDGQRINSSYGPDTLRRPLGALWEHILVELVEL
jgi:hypothetical protein